MIASLLTISYWALTSPNYYKRNTDIWMRESYSATSQQQQRLAAEPTSLSSHHRRHRKSLSLRRRKKKKMDDSSSSLSHDESTTDLSFSTNSAASNKSRRRRLRRLLKALSFEGRKSRHNKSSSSGIGRPKDVQVIMEGKPLALDSPTEEQQQRIVSGHSEQQTNYDLDIASATVDDSTLQMATRATFLDEELFFDSNDFAERDRESILLDNVLAIQPGGAIYLKPGETIEATSEKDKEAQGKCLASPPSSMAMVLKHMQTGNGPEAPPPAPQFLPLRFLRAGKMNVTEGKRRYKATLDWRRENAIDTILREPNPWFQTIKQHYPHYCHGTGFNGSPVYIEQPPRTNLKAIYQAGASIEDILRHYVQVTEFQWNYLNRLHLAVNLWLLGLRQSKLWI